MESINFKNTIKPEEIKELKVFTEKIDEEDSTIKVFLYIKKDDLDDLPQILYRERYKIDKYYQHYLLERIYYDKENPNPENLFTKRLSNQIKKNILKVVMFLISKIRMVTL